MAARGLRCADMLEGGMVSELPVDGTSWLPKLVRIVAKVLGMKRMVSKEGD